MFSCKRCISLLLALSIFLSTPLTLVSATETSVISTTLLPQSQEAIFSGSCGDNLTWTLSEDGVLVISGSGNMDHYSKEQPAPWFDQRHFIQTIVLERGVASIGDYAFYECGILTSLDISDTVTAIGKYAFTACADLSDVVLPDGIISIADGAFQSCTSLAWIYIPASVRTIGDSVFVDCCSLQAIQVDYSNPKFSNDEYGGLLNRDQTKLIQFPAKKHVTAYTVPESVTWISRQAFFGCTGIYAITLPENLAVIDDYAFENCQVLQTIRFLGGPPAFGENVFMDVSAEAYYPHFNNAWTEDMLQGYGGKVSWIPWFDCQLEGHNYVPEVTAPSCTQQGYTTYICIQCYDRYISDYTEMIPHEYEATLTQPTCTEEGYTTHTCKNCGASYQDDYTAVIPHENEIVIVDPTCTEQGYTIYTCTVCGNVERDHYTDALGHQFADGVCTVCNVNQIVAEGTCGSNLSWVLDCDGLLTISGTGAMNRYGSSGSQPWYPYLSQIYTLVIEDGVTVIGYSAFYRCRNLVSVSIPDSVVTIESDAFASCESLVDLTLGNGVTSIGQFAFRGCESLKSIDISNNVTFISNAVFEGCSSLEHVTLPENLTTIPQKLLYNCNQLKDFTIPSGVTSIGDSAFYNCRSLTELTLPDYVTSIGSQAFFGCSRLTSFHIPNTVSFIPEKAFLGCSSLTSLTLPDSVTSIGPYAFYNCRALADLTLSSNLVSIDSYAFENCSSLTSLYIPASVTDIGSSAFRYCTSLKEIIFVGDAPTIAANAFSDTWDFTSYYPIQPILAYYPILNATWTENYLTNYGGDIKWVPVFPCFINGCSYEVTITEPTCTTLGCTISICSVCGAREESDYIEPLCHSYDNGICSRCGTAEHIVATGICGTDMTWKLDSDGILTISGTGEMDFDGPNTHASAPKATWESHADSIKIVVIEEGVSTIERWSFVDCTNLISVKIADSVTSIGYRAFAGCSSLKVIRIPDSVTTLGYSVFSGCKSLAWVTLSNAITVIPQDAFIECVNLRDINLPEGLEVIDDGGFHSCESLAQVILPQSLTILGEGAFFCCYKLTEVSIPSAVEKIGVSCFTACNLTEITIPENVREIGNSCFYGCNALEKIVISGNNVTIDGNIFPDEAPHVEVFFEGSAPIITSPTSHISRNITAYYHGMDCGWNDVLNLPWASNATWVNLDDGTADHVPEVVAGKDPTCTEDGYLPYTICTICERLLGEICPLYATGHIYKTVIIAPTCTSSGHTEHICKKCGTLYTDDYIESTGHYYNYTQTVAPACTERGYDIYTCEDCGETHMYEYTDPTGHTYGETQEVSPTCTDIGYEFRLCIDCGDRSIGDSKPVADHVYLDGRCTQCGRSERFDGGSCGPDAFWELTCDGTLYIYGAGQMDSYESYPDYNDLPWEEYKDMIVGVEIGNDITVISNYAFRDCSNLTSLKLGSSLKSINVHAFSECTGLTTVSIPDNITTIDCFAFYECENLIEIVGGKKITTIDAYAFSGCTALTGFSIPASVTNIGYYAFEDCASMTSFSIPAGVTRIGNRAFEGCAALEKFYVDESNLFYTSDDSGCLYNEDMTTLLCVPMGISGCCVIPNSIKKIESEFQNRALLTSISIPASLTSIRHDAFDGCDALERISVDEGNSRYYSDDKGCLYEKAWNILVYVPNAWSGDYVISDGVTKIDGAFRNCARITSITIPASTIGQNGNFDGCIVLEKFYVDESHPYYFADNSGCLFCTVKGPDEETWVELACVPNALSGDCVIPEGVKEIGTQFRNRSRLRSITIPASVTSIDAHAFDGCTALERIYVDESNPVFTSGDSGCLFSKDLTLLYVPGNISDNCVIPDGVTELGTQFSGHSRLRSITIPASVTSIATNAFDGCTALERIFVDESNPRFRNNDSGCLLDKSGTQLIRVPNATTGDFVVDESITVIGAHAFRNSTGLTSITIGSNVHTIRLFDYMYYIDVPAIYVSEQNPYFFLDEYGCLYEKNAAKLLWTPPGISGSCCILEGTREINARAFAHRTKLTDIQLPDSVISIGDAAFYDCTNLSSIHIPNGVMTIPDDAFYCCTSLSSIHIPESVIAISASALTECANLNDISVDENNPYYYTDDFGVLFYRNGTAGTKLICAPTNLSGEYCVPDGTEEIGYHAFSGCEYLTRLCIPASVQYISHKICFGCIRLTEFWVDPLNLSYKHDESGNLYHYLDEESYFQERPEGRGSFHTIPQGVETVHDSEFNNSTIESITIPSSVTQIGDAAFANSINLSTIIFSGDAPIFGSTAEPADHFSITSDDDQTETVTKDGIFHDVTANVYYPSNNPTWSEEIKQDYGGNLTWLPYEPGEAPSDHTHNYITYVSDGNATCTENGTKTAKCTICDITNTITDKDSALGHEWNEGEIITEPTMDTAGERLRICTRCAKKYTDRIPPLSHVHSYGFSFTAATCTEAGYTTYTCECGDSYVADETPALGHAWEGTSCTRCGETRENPFSDVIDGTFYFDSVLWAVAEGITNGATANTFNPNDTCLRAHVVTFLHRAAGIPDPTSNKNPFTDVRSSDFFYKPVLWAVENGITNGTSSSTFGSYANCNRAAVVTFLWRAAGSPEPESTHNPFVDVKATDFFYKPVLWAVENGITNGVDATHFGPATDCNRAQVVTFLYRAYN